MDEELSRDILVEHSQHPRHHGELDAASHQATGHNPLCGDKIEIELKLDAQDRIQALAIRCVGCAISTASASLMAEALQGGSREQAEVLFRKIHEGITRADGCIEDELGELAALNVVRRYPLRVKCATLAWHALMAALETRENTISTEG